MPPLKFESVFGALFDGGFVVRQIQRAFLATAAKHGGEDGESDDGKQQTLHGEKSLKNECSEYTQRPGNCLCKR